MATLQELKISQAIKVKPFLDIVLIKTDDNIWSNAAAYVILENDKVTFYNQGRIYEDGLDETLKEVTSVEKVIPIEDVVIIN